MYKYILQSVDGVQWFDIIPTLLFFTTFVMVIGMVIFQKKSHFAHIERLPLDDDNQESLKF